jgi:cytochrome c-type biogenesis protein CcmH
MTLFAILAALLTLLALAFLLWPLLRREKSAAAVAGDALNVTVYRDQLRELDADRAAGVLTPESYQHARAEIERRVLEDAGQSPTVALRPAGRASVWSVGIAAPLLAAGVYFIAGTPRALTPVELPRDASKGVTHQQVEAMVAKLAERMKQNPDDPQGWAMLGRSYAVMRRFDDAAQAYAQAAKRAPDSPHVLTDYADALAMARGQSLQGEPEALVLRALKIDPNHHKALALAGSAAMERNDAANAIPYWEKLATLIPPDGEMARDIQASIREARAMAQGGAKLAEQKAAASGVTGTVTLAPALQGKVSANDTLFVFARTAGNDGPRMPLALLKRKAGDLPLQFTLDDSMAMSPAGKLSASPKIIVSARISKSGEAMPRAGDLQGATSPVNNPAQGLRIVIDTEVQ